MADWNSLIDDPLFNAGLGLLGGASTGNPWGAAADQLNKYQALRQNREYQRMHAKVYEAQARKADLEAQESANSQARWAQFVSQLPPEQQAAASAFGPKEFGGKYMDAHVFPKLENELGYTPQGREQRVLRNPYGTEVMPLGGFKQDIPNDAEIAGEVKLSNALLPNKLAQAAASAARVNVGGPQIVMPKDLSKAAADILSDSKAKAEDAVASLNSLSQIETALNSGKVRTGPGTTPLQYLDQLGIVLGVAGADTKERVANTRSIMQSMAQQELATAGLMKGQGQITENERKLIAQASLGKIDDMTEPEIRILVGGLRKTANSRLTAHGKMVDQTERDYPGSATYFGVQTPASGDKAVARTGRTKDGKRVIEYTDGTREIGN